MNLSIDQERAYQAALAGENVLISGPGGVGKSMVIGKIIEALKLSGREVRVTASTGVAAVNVGGETIHRFMGTQILGSIEELEREIEHGSILKWTRPGRIRETQVLVVDEVSMLTGDYVDMMDHWMRRVRNEVASFGGVQMVWVGDFFQLPPVIKNPSRVKKRLAFQANAWVNAEPLTVDMATNFRQDDPILIKHLNDIRCGAVSQQTLDFFNQRVGASVLNATKLCPTNAEAHKINLKRLMKLPGKMHTYKAHAYGLGNDERRKEVARKRITKDCIADAVLNLKPECPVIFIKNDYDLGFHNGESGVVTLCGSETVTVEHSNGNSIRLEVAKWELKSAEGKVEAELHQIPVKPAYALTVHKAQGLTLDRLQISSGRTFAPGQMYVALSRMRRMGGLTLVRPLVVDDIRADREVVRFYSEQQKTQKISNLG